jgi:hypothetical protein
MDVVGLYGEIQNLTLNPPCRLAQQSHQLLDNRTNQDLPTPGRYPHEVVVQNRDAGVLVSE